MVNSHKPNSLHESDCKSRRKQQLWEIQVFSRPVPFLWLYGMMLQFQTIQKGFRSIQRRKTLFGADDLARTFLLFWPVLCQILEADHLCCDAGQTSSFPQANERQFVFSPFIFTLKSQFHLLKGILRKCVDKIVNSIQRILQNSRLKTDKQNEIKLLIMKVLQSMNKILVYLKQSFGQFYSLMYVFKSCHLEFCYGNVQQGSI